MMGGVIFVVFFVIALRRGRREGVALPRTSGWIGKAFLFLTWVAVIGPAGLVVFLALAPPMLLLLTPRLVLRRLVVPLGLPRLAYWTARIASPPELINDSGLGTCYGTLALGRRKSTSPRSAAWLAAASTARASRARRRGGGSRAAGRTAPGPHPRPLPVRLGRHPASQARPSGRPRPGTGLARRRGGTAGRLAAGGAPRPARPAQPALVLWHGAAGGTPLRRAASPARHLAVCLLDPRAAPTRDASPAAPRLSTPPGALGEPLPAADLPAALGALAGLLDRMFAHDRSSLADAVGAIDALLDGPETKELVHRRLAALGAPQDCDAVLSGVRTRLTGLLAPVVEEAPRLGGTDTGVVMLDRASDAVRARWFKDIEAQCKDYTRRSEAETALGMMAEWEIWAVLRDKAERLLDLEPGSAQILFQAMYLPVNNFAVFQQNKCKRRMLAFDMYSWIRARGRHDAAASQLLDKNIKSCKP